MIRTQIQLTDDQLRRLRFLAREQAVSLAEMIRRCIDRALSVDSPGREESYARAAKLIGSLKDPDAATDLSCNHDQYLDDALR